MAKKTKKTRQKLGREAVVSQPKFPYTINPPDLRKLLQMIPEKPKPPSLTTSTAKTWGIKNSNVSYAVTVLRDIGLIEQGGAPTDAYVAYMTKTIGGKALGALIKERYKLLFEHSQNPQNASNEELQNFFNIHSGGAATTINYQIRTFKTLCEFATFDENYIPPGVNNPPGGGGGQPAGGATIHFDFHLHLPEGKSTAEYEAIIKAISEHIVSKMRS